MKWFERGVLDRVVHIVLGAVISAGCASLAPIVDIQSKSGPYQLDGTAAIIIPPITDKSFRKGRWIEFADAADMSPLYAETMATEAQATLSCKIAYTGHLRDCTIGASPNTPEFMRLFQFLAQAMRLDPRQAREWVPTGERIQLSFRVRNERGVESASRPCLPPFCNTVVPPPAPPPAPAKAGGAGPSVSRRFALRTNFRHLRPMQRASSSAAPAPGPKPRGPARLKGETFGGAFINSYAQLETRIQDQVNRLVPHLQRCPDAPSGSKGKTMICACNAPNRFKDNQNRKMFHVEQPIWSATTNREAGW